MSKKYPYSVHSFMLPLRWDYLPSSYTLKTGKKAIPFDIRTDLSIFNKFIQETPFKRKFYRIDGDPVNYNEFVYFHSFITVSLFDLQQPDEKEGSQVSAHKVMCYYEIDCCEQDYFKMLTDQQEFELQLTGISIHVFNTGVAILTYNLENYNYPQSESILMINDLGRRVYPPYLGSIEEDARMTAAPKKSILANRIALFCSALQTTEIVTDYKEYDYTAQLETYHYQGDVFTYTTIKTVPSIVTALFDRGSFTFKMEDERADCIKLNYLKDDRMFFQCWYGNDSLANFYSRKKRNGDSIILHSSFWSAYLNGDRSSDSLGLGNSCFMYEENKRSSYLRWAEYGTVFGLTKDSFVCLSSSIETLKSVHAPLLHVHMKTMYYQMAVLSLAQRCSMLRFSAEVAGLSDLGKTNESKAADSIKKLYLNYIEFVNKIYFREVTYQIQGREIYEQFQKVMNLQEDITSLENELEELNHFASIISQDKITQETQRLNWIAMIFLPASILFSIMGANFFSTDSHDWKIFSGWDVDALTWIIVGFIPSIFIFIILQLYNKITRK